MKIVGTLALAKIRKLVTGLLLVACWAAPFECVAAGPLGAADAAYVRGDYTLVVKLLTPLALRGDPRAQALLGFMFENGYGAPQVYYTAASLYQAAALRGNPFGQAMLGLMYDKGHGVPQDFILAYKWLNLAAGRSSKHERDYVLRLRNAVASKMSSLQIAEGQRLAMLWVAARQ
ncbi:sel1 repeat family protein [Bradyrhizobium sp. KB893862 SZCCT0404]|uniref:tetratricopeptide repeat protein n=1 Tax=Bradyrhizobium sp. KB893862 SZCCT0404 TaxID=2807672 RepID=UPI001BADC05E|nr:tetratricopeptide repeat protein [Bradyrhizobium sp. KB893862 SZCCT0404]MBR1175265.1 sel1 repeat family protein [Bradyrhizobium sp. KB893862 SZCCT0404]